MLTFDFNQNIHYTVSTLYTFDFVLLLIINDNWIINTHKLAIKSGTILFITRMIKFWMGQNIWKFCSVTHIIYVGEEK
jgi:hypothetical protein